ncbi:MAG TPA: sulfite reductase flavoprotein subunit alpha, partial [Burkholderiales bacterium]|nr:sulfite reductase flavoprotein subunit alpha [Burkholderiales bacterium]
YLPEDATHIRASNKISIRSDGKTQQHERYAEKPAGAKLIASNYVLHTGEFFGLPGRVIFFLSSMLMPLFAITGWLLYLDRRKSQTVAKKTKRALRASTSDRASDKAAEWLIAFASQSGHAERLAWQTADVLQSGGMVVAVHPLNGITRDMLNGCERALFVVSSFGQGEAPDAAKKFERNVMRENISLSKLRFGLLALGDRQYATFCGFGRALHGWLSQQGAQPLFETVEVDRSDTGALEEWNQSLQDIGATGQGAWSDWKRLPSTKARFAERRLLNANSLGGPLFHVVLEPCEGLHWEPGDLVRVQPRNSERTVEYWLAHAGLDGKLIVSTSAGPCAFEDLLSRCVLPPVTKVNDQGLEAFVATLQPLVARTYTISSLKEEGRIELLIRQERLSGEQLGIGSGWLTEHASATASIDIEVQSNPNFHLPQDDRPLLLIGNGTGLAGLRALIKARAWRGHHANWLVYGERQERCDFHYREELEAWRTQDVISMDLAFSRDQTERIYVQHRLRQSAEQVRSWVAQGAAIYVCGSAVGMATGVDEALREILGVERLAVLNESGRYRRDVY